MKIKDLAYIHDLGGLKTTDGHTIKPKLLYRSSHLGEISDESVDFLADELNIHHVVDLRTKDEKNYIPEEFIKRRINYHEIQMVPDEVNPAVTKENRIRILNELCALEGGMRKHILDLYRLLLNSEMAINGYKEVFKMLLENENEGYLFHCTQGKDRTGMVVYMILSALGVSRENFTKVYLSFNHRARFKRTMYFIGMNALFLSFTKAKALNDTLTARKSYLRVVFDVIDNTYGGIDNYLKNQIGLSKDDINRLRDIYLK